MKRLLKFVPFLFLLIACEEKLPKPTQSGSNTFACKLNGKTWIADAGTGFNTKKILDIVRLQLFTNQTIIYLCQPSH